MQLFYGTAIIPFHPSTIYPSIVQEKTRTTTLSATTFEDVETMVMGHFTRHNTTRVLHLADDQTLQNDQRTTVNCSQRERMQAENRW